MNQQLYVKNEDGAFVPAAGVQGDGIASYAPGRWFDARTVDEMKAFYMSRLPAIRAAAHDHGYAIGLHGSARRDFDLMAMQWREAASDRDSLARAIADAACGIRREGSYDWEQKPNHRVATSIPICWTDHDNPDFDNMISAGHIDLSLIDKSNCCTEQIEIHDSDLLPTRFDDPRDQADHDAIFRVGAYAAKVQPDSGRDAALPVNMVLHCPACSVQHIDAPDERGGDWLNPPHRSHLCHGCGHIWRPADVPTNGVSALQTEGKADSPIASPSAIRSNALEEAAKIADSVNNHDNPMTARDVADAIRALAAHPAPSSDAALAENEIRLAITLGEVQGTLRCIYTVSKEPFITKKAHEAYEKIEASVTAHPANGAQAGDAPITDPNAKGYRPPCCNRGRDKVTCCELGCAADQELAILAAAKKGGAA